MPNRTIKAAVDASSRSTVRVNWKSIVGAAGNGAKAIFSPIMPATVNTASSMAGAMKDLRDASRLSKTSASQQKSAIKNSSENKKANALFNAAMNDIGSGSYDVDKISNDLGDDYDSLKDNFTMPTGDDAANMSSEEIILTSNAGVAKSVMQSGNAQLRGMQAVSKSIINANIKTTKAMSGVIVNALNFGFNQINTTLLITNRKLDMVNQNLNTINQFNNKNTLEFYTKSIDMMNGLGKMMENLQKSMNPDPRSSRRFDTSMGFNIKEYFKYVKEGLQETIFGTGASAVSGSSRGGKGGASGGLLGTIIEAVLPKKLTDPFKNFDKTVQRFFDNTLKRIGDALDNNEMIGFLGLGSVFGNKREVRNRLNLGNYSKDAMPWNGLAQKALVEVIPELLSSIDAGINKTEKRHYDYQKGKFYRQSQIEEAFDREYFDRLAFSLKDSMEALQKAVESSGRSQKDQERLMKHMQGMIDDQVSGRVDYKTGKRNIERSMYDFGIGETMAKRFMQEFQEGLESGLKDINDFFHEINSTQSIYRNINNQSRSEYMRQIDAKHDRRQNDYRAFKSLPDPSGAIRDLQRKLGMTEVDVSKDDDLISEMIILSYTNASLEEKSAAVAQAYQKAKMKAGVTERLTNKGGIRQRIEQYRTNAENLGQRIEGYTDTATNRMYEIAYGKSYYAERGGTPPRRGRGATTAQEAPKTSVNQSVTPDQTQAKPKRSSKQVGRATTFFTKNRKDTSVRASAKAADIGIETALTSFDKTMKASSSELDKTEKVLDGAIKEMDREPPATDVATSIVQSNNIIKTTLGTLLHHIQGFGARLFGKDGFFRKIWDSEARKKATDKLKEKLFTGDKAIFKKQYEGLKSGAKNTWTKAKVYLGRGYNYLYDNTMTYLYGRDDEGNDIDYKTNERYQNNKFLSQTINLRWRREQARKKRIEERKKAQEEGLKTSTNQPESETKSTDLGKEMEQATTKLKTSVNEAVDGVAESAKQLQENTDKAVETIVGDTKESPDSKKKKFQQTFVQKLKSTAPKALAGAIAGFGVGALNNSFSILGSMFLPGGPIAGAIVGGGLAILSQTEAFKTFMFGKLDEKTQKREGGLISEKTRAHFKKLAPAIVGGAVVGGISSIIKGALGFNTGLGVLGMQILPGGILGGAILGAGMGILKNSETFKNFLFGKKDENGKRAGTAIGKGWEKAKAGFKDAVPVLKKAGTGLAIGALTGTVLSNMGYIPAMLSLGGPVGLGIAGLGLGIASSTKKFNEWMFGTEMVDKDGNVIGRNKDGMLTRVTNMLRVNIIEPIGTAFKNKMLDLVDWTKDKITYPFRLAFGPILDSLLGIKDNVVDFVKDKFEALGNGIMDMMRKTTKTLFSPVTKLIGFIGKSMIGMASTGAKVALALPSMGLQAMSFLTAGKRRKEYVEFYKNYYSKGNIMGELQNMWDAQAEDGKKRNFFGKISDTIGAYIGQGPVADAARAGWNAQMTEDGKNHLRWRNVGTERRQLREDRKTRRRENRQWQNIDKFRKKLAEELGYREVTFNDATVKQYREKFKKLGIDEKYLQTSDDLMELIYRKNDFTQRINGGKAGGLINTESPEQAAAREKTSKYQDHVTEVLDKIQVKFGILAADANERKAMKTANEDWSKDLDKLGTRLNKRLGKKGMKNINLKDPSLRDYNIKELDDDLINGFRWSTEYQTGDLKGYMDRMKITKFSEYKEEKDKAKQVAADIGETPISDITSGFTIQDTPSQAAFKDNLLDLVGSIKKAITGETESPMKTAQENTEEVKILTEKLTEQNKDLLSATEDNANANEAQATAAVKANETKSSWWTKLAFWKKRKSRRDAEDAQSKAAQGLGDKVPEEEEENPDINVNVEQQEEKKSLLSRILDGVKGFGSAFASSKVGGFLIKAAKVLGGFGLIAGLGIGLLEIVKPGSQDKILAQTKELSTAIEEGRLWTDYIGPQIEKAGAYFTDTVMPAFGKKITSGADWLADNFPTIFEDHILPGIERVGNFFANNAEGIVNVATKLIEAFVPPVAEAFVKVVPTIVGSFAKAIYNATLGKLTGIYPFGKPSEKQNVDLDKYPDITDGEQFAKDISEGLKVTTTDPVTGEVITFSGKSATYNPETNEVEITKEKNTTTNQGVVGAAGRTALRAITESHVGGIVGAGARAGGRILGAVPGGIVGGTAGGTLGIMGGVPGFAGGMVTGTAKGARVGSRAASRATGAINRALVNATSGSHLLSQFVGSRQTGKIVSGVTADALQLSREQLEETIQTAVNRSLANASAGGGNLAVKLATEEASYKALNEAVSTAVNATLESNNMISTMSKEQLEAAIKQATDNLIKGTGESTATEAAAKLAKTTAKEATEAGVDAAVKETKKKGLKAIFEKITGAISKLKDNTKLGQLIAKFTADNKIVGKFIKAFSDIIEKLFKNVFSDDKIWMKVSTKLASGLAEAGLRTTPLAILFSAYDLVNGAWGAANLFRVSSEDCDWLMRLISAVFEFVLGLPVICWLNLILEVVQGLMNKDYKSEWASAIYKALAPDDGGAGLVGDQGLTTGQTRLEMETEKYNAEHGTQISTSEYNDKVNKGIGGTILDAGKEAVNFFGGLFGKDEPVFETQWNAKQKVSDEEVNAEVARRQAAGYGPGGYMGNKFVRVNTKSFSHIPLGYGSQEVTANTANNILSNAIETVKNLASRTLNAVSKPIVELVGNSTIKNNPDATTTSILKTLADMIAKASTVYAQDPTAGLGMLPSIASAILALFKDTSRDNIGALQQIILNLQNKDTAAQAAITSNALATGNIAMKAAAKKLKIPEGSLRTVEKAVNAGYGPGSRPADFYKQGNNKWANMPIGYFPSGQVATMQDAGCGPTAMAAVANQLAMGYGPAVGYGPAGVNPAQMAAYAASNGYISGGGANEGLFTEGAARLGMRANTISDSKQLQANLAAGKPTILTGSSTSSSDPYTSAGHIVVAKGLVGNKAKILDPMTGKQKLYDLNSVSRSTKHAWSYSNMGYGKGSRYHHKPLGYGFTDGRGRGGGFTASGGGGFSGSYQITGNTEAARTARQWVVDVATGRKKLTNVTQLPFNIGGLYDEILADAKIYKSDTAAGRMQYINGGSSISSSAFNLGLQSVNKVSISLNNIDVKYGKYKDDLLDYVHRHNKVENNASGVDTFAMTNNRNSLKTNLYWHNKYRNEIDKLDKIKISLRGRDGSMVEHTLLAFVANSQYFPFNGGTYGTEKIEPYMVGVPKDYSKPDSFLYSAWLNKYCTAAIISMQDRGLKITAPLSDAEKFLAICNGLRVRHGLANMLVYFSKHTDPHTLIGKVEDAEVKSEADANGAVDSALATAVANAAPSGISNAQQLREILSNASFFTRMKYVGYIGQAQVNAMLNGTEFWEEFAKLTTSETSSEESEDGTTSTVSSSASLQKFKTNASNIREELLAKTMENIYYHESRGAYDAVNQNDNGLTSIGPYQARGNNAVTLLNNLAAVDGLASEPKAIFKDLTGKIGQRVLTNDEVTKFKSAMNTSASKSKLQAAADSTGMQLIGDAYYKKYLSKYYDDKRIKDFRTLPMLADIGNAGIGYIVGLADKNSRWHGRTFIDRWKPTSKEAELNAAYQTLVDPNEFYYKNGYAPRITTTYENLKGYTFKHSVPTGKTLQSYFENVGYGPGQNVYGTAETTKAENAAVVGNTGSSNIGDTAWGKHMAKLTDTIVQIGADKYGLDLFSTSSDGSTTGAISSSVSADGGEALGNSAQPGEQLTSARGTDRARFLAVAKSQIGYYEKLNSKNLKSFTAYKGNGNYSKYGKEIGSNPNAWCAYFTSWAGKAAGIPTDIVYRNGGCTNMVSEYLKRGNFYYRNQITPEPGDIIFYTKDWKPVSDANLRGTTGSAHVGIVTGYDGGDKIQTVEGNTSMSADSNYNGVSAKNRSFNNTVLGFARPNWTGEYKEVNPSELLSVGYGKGPKTIKIDDAVRREQLRRSIDNQPDFQVDPREFEALGFGPGMKVDAGFDMTNTDSKLDQIFNVIAQWYTDSQKKAAESSDTKSNIVAVNQNNINVNGKKNGKSDIINPAKYKERMVSEHATLAYKQNIRNTM